MTSDRDREPWGILIALHPMWAIGVLALGAGIVLPNLVLMDQLVPMLRSLFYALTGRGINAGFDPAELFSAFRDQWREPALLLQLPFPALALIGLVRCYRAGDRSAVVWSVAAVSMFVLAALRGVVHPSTHHYAPAMSLCIPLVLSAMTMQWSAAPSIGARRAIGGVLTLPWARVLPLIAALVLAVGPVATAMRSSRLNHARCEAIDSLARQLEPRLGAREFIMTDYWAQNGDSGYFMLLRDFCRYTPERHFRALPDTPPALEYAATLGRRPAYYLTSGESRTKLERLSDGRLVASSIWGGRWYVRLVETHALANITISMYAVEGSVSADSSRGERVILVEGAGLR